MGRHKKEHKKQHSIQCHPKVIKDVRKYADEKSEEQFNKDKKENKL